MLGWRYPNIQQREKVIWTRSSTNIVGKFLQTYKNPSYCSTPLPLSYPRTVLLSTFAHHLKPFTLSDSSCIIDNKLCYQHSSLPSYVRYQGRTFPSSIIPIFSCIITSSMQDQDSDVPGDRGHLPEEDMRMYVYITSPESTKPCSPFPHDLLACTSFPFVLRSDANV